MHSFDISTDQLQHIGIISFGIWVMHAVSMNLAERSFGDMSTKEMHLAGHQAVSLVIFTIMAVLGTNGWVNLDASYGDCFEKRTTGFCAASEVLIKLMAAFQTYEVLIALYVPKLRGPGCQMLIHHVATLTLSVVGLGFQYTHFYALFFLGMVEISSVPLSVMDMFKFFPALAARHPVLAENTKVLFAVSFLPTRVLYFPYMSAGFWADAFIDLSAGIVPVWVVMTFLVSNLILTGLQFYWGSLVIKGIIRKATGQKDSHTD